jgi:aspartate dehydrogenase
MITVGLAGFGTVGQELARRLTAGAIPEVRLAAVAALDLAKAHTNAAKLAAPPQVVPLAELPRHAEIIVECATAMAFPEIARTVLSAGRTLIAVSAGGVPQCPDMVEIARRHGGRIKIASGALPGLDAIRGAKEGAIRSVKLTSQLKPESLAHEDYIRAKGFDFSTPPPAPVKVFEGSAGAAAAAFPRHFNVAITLSLGGIGFDKTQVEVWSNPTVAGAVHQVEVDADDINLTMISRNRPSATNPRTSRMVAPSIMAALRSLVDPLQVGS